jgi:hypothetical protein
VISLRSTTVKEATRAIGTLAQISSLLLASQFLLRQKSALNTRNQSLNPHGELLEAGLGEKNRESSIDLAEELDLLGYDKELFTSQLPTEARTLRITHFLHTDPSSQETLVTFCTDGLRQYGIDQGQLGTELVAQFRLKDVQLAAHSPEGPLHDFRFVHRVFTLGWILLQSRRDKTLEPGLGLSAETPLNALPRCDLSGIFLTRYKRIPLPQRTEKGRFCYLNVLTVTEDELRFSELRSSDHLISLLQEKNIDQVCPPKRRSIFARGEQVELPLPSHALSA